MQDRKEEALACTLRQAELYREEGSPIAEQFAMANVVGAETELGRPEEALEHARAAIARLDALGVGAAAGHLRDGAVVAATLLGRLDEAMAHARVAYQLLKREGDEFRVLESLVLPVALSGRLEDAATMTGFLDALHRLTGEVLRVHQARYRARATALVDAGIGVSERTRLQALGATLNDEQAFMIAFGDPALAIQST
jgi:tetratricopeptide (TPR) repeat protein